MLTKCIPLFQKYIFTASLCLTVFCCSTGQGLCSESTAKAEKLIFEIGPEKAKAIVTSEDSPELQKARHFILEKYKKMMGDESGIEARKSIKYFEANEAYLWLTPMLDNKQMDYRIATLESLKKINNINATPHVIESLKNSINEVIHTFMSGEEHVIRRVFRGRCVETIEHILDKECFSDCKMLHVLAHIGPVIPKDKRQDKEYLAKKSEEYIKQLTASFRESDSALREFIACAELTWEQKVKEKDEASK